MDSCQFPVDLKLVRPDWDKYGTWPRSPSEFNELQLYSNMFSKSKQRNYLQTTISNPPPLVTFKKSSDIATIAFYTFHAD